MDKDDRLLTSRAIIIFLTLALASCGESKDTPLIDSSGQIAVWSNSSSQADLYLLSLNELSSVGAELPSPVGSILRTTATLEQLTALEELTVDRPFVRTAILCDAQAGYDVFYLIITDKNGTTRRFSQYSECGFSFSQGDGFFQEQANGFLVEQQICDFGLSFGVEGFLCTAR